MSFIGNTPAESYSTVVKDTFSGNGSTTAFTLSIPATTNSVEVFVENVQQEPTDAYTISGTTLSFTAAPVTGTDNIYVIHRGPAVQQVVPPAGVAIDASTVTASSTISATGNISTEGDLKVEVSSGGIYTITGTDTSSNRTLTLPDEAGTVLTSGTTASSIPGYGNQITVADQWYLTSNFGIGSSAAVVNSGWARTTAQSDAGTIGSAMTESSGVFSFPSTGIYLINFQARFLSDNSAQLYIYASLQVTTNNSSYTNRASPLDSFYTTNAYGSSSGMIIFDVTDISTHKVRVLAQTQSANANLSGGTERHTALTFLKIGDT